MAVMGVMNQLIETKIFPLIDPKEQYAYIYLFAVWQAKMNILEPNK